MSDNKFPRGSEWRKWDLHFHTPSSYDYWDKSVTNEDLINKLAENNVSAVSITDHHIIDIDRIKELQKIWNGKNIVVFPWIEFLSDARWNDPIHFIAIFWECSKIEYIWWQLENKTNISKIKWEWKKENEVYCDLEDTINLVHKLWWIVTIHSWQKHWSIECITNSLSHTVAQKTDIAKLVDIYELWKEEDQKWYRDKVFPAIWKVLPMIICSDNHNVNKYATKQNCWIKADPTFEWLKQIIYEPEERVKIQANKPEEKTWYQAIDKIIIKDCEDIEDSEIVFNQNLNTIIWWRSTWKSILLWAIAKKLKLEHSPDYETDYNNYIQSISDKISIFWKDWTENNNREVEYFKQSYIYDLSKNREKLNNIIEKILRQKWKEEEKDNNKELDNYNKFIFDNSKAISSGISDLFQILLDITKIKQIFLDLWDKSWVEKEIEKLNEELKRNSTIQITDEEKVEYEHLKKKLEDLMNNRNSNNNDFENIEKLKFNSFLKETIDYELISITDEWRKEDIKNFYLKLKEEFNEKWSLNIDEINKKIISDNLEIENLIKEINENSIYIKVTKAFTESVQLQEIEKKLKMQKEKLIQIENIIKKIESLDKQKTELIKNIKDLYNKYQTESNIIVSKLSDKVDWLEIKSIIWINEKKYKENLENSLNNIRSENKSALSSTSDKIFEVFDSLIEWSLSFKWWFNAESLLKKIMTENLYEIHYELIYEWDIFGKMSDWKKAFVVLKLLLDFSDKECPILIDQPEDDLDNRSICKELVEYLKKKKKQRQIIVATHNPNVVVTADAEEIIVANQNWTWNPNNNWKKFQYISWSLENTKTLDKIMLTTSILNSQWIKEHVCDIVEWWEVAFDLRKKKYKWNS